MKILTRNTLLPMWPKQILFSKLLLILTLMVGVSACHRPENTQVSTIMGMLGGGGKTVVRLSELDARSLIPLDSVVTGSDGSFVFALPISEPTFYQISTPQSDPLTLVIKPGDKIVVEGKADQLLWARISGSDESSLLQQYLQESRMRMDTAEFLVKLLADKSSAPGFKLLRDSVSEALEGLFQRHRSFSMHFIQSHSGTLAGLIAINQPFGRRPVFDPLNDRELFIAFDSSLRHNYPQSKHALFFHQRMAEMKKAEAVKKMRIENLMPGKPVPYFRIPSLQQGQWLSPGQFKGEPFLLVFWTPTEGKQTQQLSQIFKKISSSKKPLRVLCVAFETEPARWQNAVKNAGLTAWHHGSDLKGTASPLYELFVPDNRPLPQFLLVDAEGNIILTTSDTREITQAVSKL
jgi:hypothetical protein